MPHISHDNETVGQRLARLDEESQGVVRAYPGDPSANLYSTVNGTSTLLPEIPSLVVSALDAGSGYANWNPDRGSWSFVSTVGQLVPIDISVEQLDPFFPEGFVCPNIPGVVFSVLPNLTMFGQIAGGFASGVEFLENLTLLSARTKVAQLAQDVETEMASGLNSLEDSFKTFAMTAADELKQLSVTDLVSAYDAVSGSSFGQAIEAVTSGVVDISALDVPISDLPAAVLETAFNGFQDAQECLTGIVGGAQDLFNKKSDELVKGFAQGRGATNIKDFLPAVIPIIDELTGSNIRRVGSSVV